MYSMMFLRTPVFSRKLFDASQRLASSFVKLIRQDEKACRESLETGDFLLFHKGRPLVDRDGYIAWKTLTEAKKCSDTLESDFIFLGLDPLTGKPQFAAPIAVNPSTKNGGGLEVACDMRIAMLGQINARSSQVMCKAWSLLLWHRKTNFCSNCGSKLSRNFIGNHRSCFDCQSVYYPSLSPVGIVLVASADQSKVLLIRPRSHPGGMFTCLAGFVDMGESLEECVKREVAEEVGLEVDGVEVRDSQHWAFPKGSLMVGCWATAKAETEVPDIDRKELEDARWFSLEEIRRTLEGKGEVFVPPKMAIAHVLIRSWMEERGHL